MVREVTKNEIKEAIFLMEDDKPPVQMALLLPSLRNHGMLWDWYLDDGTIVGDTLVVEKVLELIIKDGPRCRLHLNFDKTKVFWPKEDPRSRLEGIFLPNISQPLHGVKELGDLASVDFDFSSELVMKRVAKPIGLMDVVVVINDPRCDLLLPHACTSIFKLYFAMRACLLRVFESAQCSFDVALQSALERIVSASRLRSSN
nr:hypothetical protein [Tanacetum cinerariifolium]